MIVEAGGGERCQLGEDFQGLTRPAGGVFCATCSRRLPLAIRTRLRRRCTASCGAEDGGGVPLLNSGVPNHAYALAVDGRTPSNGQTIAGIGLTKAAAIWFIARRWVYQTPSTTNFAAGTTRLSLPPAAT